MRTTTYTGAQQAKNLGLDKPLYNEYKLGDIVKMKGMYGKYRIDYIDESGVLVYVRRKKIFGGFSKGMDGGFWMTSIVGCKNSEI